MPPTETDGERPRRRPLVAAVSTGVPAVLIGVAAALTTVFWPAASEAVIYVITLVVLVLRPRGLMGEEGMLT